MHSLDQTLMQGQNHEVLADFLLQRINAEMPSELLCLYAYSAEYNQLDVIGWVAAATVTPAMEAQARVPLLALAEVPGVPLHRLNGDMLAGMRFTTALVFRLENEQELIGLLALFNPVPDALILEISSDMGGWLSLARAVLENRRLRASEMIAETLQLIAQSLSSNPTPQDMIDMLHDRICGPHVSTCVMMFYGPLREDRPDGPYEYLEVAGSWSKRRRSGGGVGTRIYLDNYVDFLEELHHEKMLTASSLTAINHLIDPLIRAFLRAERVQSMLWVAVTAGRRRLGVIFIATNKPHQFTSEELSGYRRVSEFLALTMMAQTLQQQHDFVLEARASMLDAVNDGVMMVIPTGSTTIRPTVLTVNQSFTRMFNLPLRVAQGLSLTESLQQMQIPQDVSDKLLTLWRSIDMRDTVKLEGEFNMIHPDGFPATIEWSSAPVRHDRRVMGRIFSFHDASASRAAAGLRANFLTRVSHELRTPLTAIQGFSQLILEKSGDELTDFAREYTEIIFKSAQHLNTLFSDIIEVTRADTGELRLQLAPADLTDIIIGSVALLEMHYQSRGQRIIMELDDDLPSVHIDASRITQVVTNLISNAIKYAPPDTRIRVRTERLNTPDDLPPGTPGDVVLPGVLVSVSDEGPGLSVEDAERVFMPFYRSKEARAGQTEGSGLGLTISRSIVELHRGKIWVDPRRRGRKGGRFLFTLPTA